MSGDALYAFAAALAAAGLEVRHVVADGRVHRVRAEGDKAGKRSGWYVLHLTAPAAGAYGDWRTGDTHRWCHASDCRPSAEELARIEVALALARAQRERERAAGRQAAQAEAKRLWQAAPVADANHAYLVTKGVGVHGIRQNDGRLLIPMRDSRGQLWGVQTIDADGSKRFGRGARKRGLYHAIGGKPERVLCLAEGYATGASIHQATGYPVAVAFDCGNLLPVAQTLRAKYPHTRLIVCADNDAATAARIGRNPGIEAATTAVQAVGGVVVSPSTDPAAPGQGMNHAIISHSGGA